jgi:ubiquitin-like protein Pup
MASKQQQKTSQSSSTDTLVEEIEEIPTESIKDQQLADDVDDILDEIDGVLEENAEAFVKSYVQKGGQ